MPCSRDPIANVSLEHPSQPFSHPYLIFIFICFLISLIKLCCFIIHSHSPLSKFSQYWPVVSRTQGRKRPGIIARLNLFLSRKSFLRFRNFNQPEDLSKDPNLGRPTTTKRASVTKTVPSGNQSAYPEKKKKKSASKQLSTLWKSLTIQKLRSTSASSLQEGTTSQSVNSAKRSTIRAILRKLSLAIANRTDYRNRVKDTTRKKCRRKYCCAQSYCGVDSDIRSSDQNLIKLFLNQCSHPVVPLSSFNFVVLSSLLSL